MCVSYLACDSFAYACQYSGGVFLPVFYLSLKLLSHVRNVTQIYFIQKFYLITGSTSCICAVSYF